MSNTIIIQYYQSPCGRLILGAIASKLCLCDWLDGKHHNYLDIQLKYHCKIELDLGVSEIIRQASTQLDEYFTGTRKEFDVPLLFVGTEFQKKVWAELAYIPYGQTISYGDMARHLGMPKAIRAVANSIGTNPISIFAPCHRVIGANGKLVGYNGGVPAKKFLLDLEMSNTLDILAIKP